MKAFKRGARIPWVHPAALDDKPVDLGYERRRLTTCVQAVKLLTRRKIPSTPLLTEEEKAVVRMTDEERILKLKSGVER